LNFSKDNNSADAKAGKNNFEFEKSSFGEKVGKKTR